jgi:Dipeptidyl peptidase IV (DPP IV) N-terminal region
VKIPLYLKNKNVCFDIEQFFFTSSRREHYFASAAWVSQTEVSVVWMNRPQNLSVVTLCKSPMWYCQEVSKAVFLKALKTLYSWYIDLITTLLNSIFSLFRLIKHLTMAVVGLTSYLFLTFPPTSAVT